MALLCSKTTLGSDALSGSVNVKLVKPMVGLKYESRASSLKCDNALSYQVLSKFLNTEVYEQSFTISI